MRIPETWYLLLLALCLVGHVGAFFYFYNQPGGTAQATLFFGLAVLTALLSRFLFARWQQNQSPRPAFTWVSFGLLLLGLLPALAAGLAYSPLHPHGG